MTKNSQTSESVKGGQNSTKARELRDSPHTGPLYRELGEIGRLQEPLDPSNLVSRKAISECEAVTQWTSGDETPEVLADYAALAIQEAVSRIQPDRDRYVAEAVVAIGDFKGLSNAQRRERITEAPYHVTRDMFDKRRPHAVGRLIHRLMRPPSLKRGPLPDRSQAGDLGIRALRILAGGSSSLHSTALAAMFVANHEIVAGSFEEDKGFLSVPIIQMAEMTLSAFMSFVSRSYYAHMLTYKHYERLHENFNIVLVVKDVLAHESVAPHLHSTAAQSVVSAYATAIEASPFSQADCDELCLSYTSTSGYDMEIAYVLNDVRWRWSEWFFEQVASPVMPRQIRHKPLPSAFECMTATVSRLLTCLRESGALSIDIDRRARWITLKRLALMYEMDETESSPVFQGTLTNRLRNFCDGMDQALAKQGDVWFANRHKSPLWYDSR